MSIDAMVLVCMRHLWTDWNLWNWFAKMGLTPYFQKIDIGSGRLQQWQGRITGRQSAWGPVISFESFWRQCYWFQSSEVTLRWRRMKSKAFLLHDGSYGCSYLIVWLMGEFISLLFTLYWILHFQEVYFGPSGTVCTWKDFRHNALEPFGHSHFANSVL